LPRLTLPCLPPAAGNPGRKHRREDHGPRGHSGTAAGLEAYLHFVRQWQDGIDYESLQARVDEDPMAFLVEVRGFARDELPPSAALLGERLAEQIAAASRSELPAGEPVRPALD
jgi:hypothetical protein